MVCRWLPLLVLTLASVPACKKKSSSAQQGSGSAVVGSNAPASKRVAEWTVIATAGTCSATAHGACPPDTECDPPPARAIACPAGLVDGTVQVAQLEDGSCVALPANAATPCPLPEGEALPPLAWAVTAAPDGTCVASWTSPATGTRSVTITCPLADVASMTIKRPAADAPCTVLHAGKSTTVPCPAEPEQFTVATLRTALAKDAAAFADRRVRVQGVYVKSMTAQKSTGQTTTYMLGVADTKGDTKQALRCTSTVPLGEAADGDTVIVEGVARPGTNNELALAACQATKP